MIVKYAFCMHCERDVSEDAVFCGHCGNKIERSFVAVTCQNCYREYEVSGRDHIYCTNCGKLLPVVRLVA